MQTLVLLLVQQVSLLTEPFPQPLEVLFGDLLGRRGPNEEVVAVGRNLNEEAQPRM